MNPAAALQARCAEVRRLPAGVSTTTERGARAASRSATAKPIHVGQHDVRRRNHDRSRVREGRGHRPRRNRRGARPAMAEFEANGGSSAELGTAVGEIYQFIQANCGFAELTVTATKYAFGGLPLQVDAGPVVLALAN